MLGYPQWVVTDLIYNEDGSKQAKPLTPGSLQPADPSDASTGRSFEEAYECARVNELRLGFIFDENDPFVAGDLDPPRNDEERARHDLIFEHMDTYTEVSASGKGIHFIGLGSIPAAVKRDHVELYDRERYFIMTGDVIGGRDEIKDIDEQVNWLAYEMGKGRVMVGTYEDVSLPAKEDDTAVLERCTKSKNGDKFAPLWAGKWQGAYPSQSEADYALMNMIVFATPNDDQARRLFRQSGLGKRKKADRDAYLNFMVGKIRAELDPPIDYSQFTLPPIAPPEPEPETAPLIIAPQPLQAPVVLQNPLTSTINRAIYPDGLVGEMAHYIEASAIRPVSQIALAASLCLMAGISGRAYNISNTGLNIYVMLVATTAIGKEGATQGINRLIKSVTPRLPTIQEFIGSTEFASGQALIKQLHQFPCQVSVLSEFGHTLKRVSNPNASGADGMWRKVLLDVYNKSGHGDTLGSMVYSDAGKNTPAVPSPAFTLLTESTPSSLYEGIDESAIEIGLIPRFLLIECPTFRPPSNPNAWAPPEAGLSARLETLATRCLAMKANNTVQQVTMSSETYDLLGPGMEFDQEVDRYINAQHEDAIRQIWSRAHMKALRLAALATVGMGHHAPVVQLPEATWAIEMVRTDAQYMLKRFGEGVGTGDPVQLSKLREAVLHVLGTKETSKLMKQHNVVTHRMLSQRVYKQTAFRQDKRGARDAMERAIRTLMDGGELIQLSPQDAQEHFKTAAKCYMVTDGFVR